MMDTATQLSDQQNCQLSLYLDLLQRWNKVHNLSALSTRQEFQQQFIDDSLLLLPYIVGNRVVDVGTGAGVPGVILAIACTNLNFTLLDSKNKKTAFLKQVVHQLKLPNVTVLNCRAEDYQGEPFDTLVCRALGSFTYIDNISSSLRYSGSRYLCVRGDFDRNELSRTSFRYIDCVPLHHQQKKIVRQSGHLIIIQA